MPEWKILDQFVTDEVHDVFGLDALDSSHPISVQVHHPDEINEIFDSISYAKGKLRVSNLMEIEIEIMALSV
jgi:aminopeptidase N